MVFRGAEEMLNSPAAPILLFEASIYTAPNLGLKATDVLDYLASLPLPNYQFFTLSEDGSFRPLEDFNRIGHENVLAVPRNRSLN